MPIFALQYQVTFRSASTPGSSQMYAGEIDIEASAPDTARRKLTPTLALNALELALKQDTTFNHDYDDLEIKIRTVREKTL